MIYSFIQFDYITNYFNKNCAHSIHKIMLVFKRLRYKNHRTYMNDEFKIIISSIAILTDEGTYFIFKTSWWYG